MVNKKERGFFDDVGEGLSNTASAAGGDVVENLSDIL